MSRMPWAGQSVIIVDDSESARETLRGLYQELGMVVKSTAANGVEALEQLENERPDLISLDINMPEMDGVECYRCILDRFQDQRIAMVSWLAQDPTVIESLRGTIPSHIFAAKPIDVDGLRALLEHVYGLTQTEERQALDITNAALEMPAYTTKVS